MSDQPRVKIIIVELESFNPAADPDGRTMAAVESTIKRALEQSKSDDAPEALFTPAAIEPDARRDHEAEARIADALETPLWKIHAGQAVLSAAGACEAGKEAARCASIEVVVGAMVRLDSATKVSAQLMQKHLPASDKVIEGVVISLIVTVIAGAAKVLG